MIPIRNVPYKANFYDNLFVSRAYRDTDYYHIRNPKYSITQELQREDLSEKMFYEKVKNYFEKSNERIGFFLGNVMEIIIEREFSAFQLFKILLNSRSKSKVNIFSRRKSNLTLQKLKLIVFEDEKNFYPQFWKVIALQRETVKVEGLKVLGFLTSEYLHNTSQQTQTECIKYLKKLSNLQFNSLDIVRLSLNCIGNLLTHSKYKIIDENQEIFTNIHDIMKNLSCDQKLKDHNHVRTLLALLRVLNCLHIDFKAVPQTVCDFFVSQLNKYLYLDTHFFPLPSSCFHSQVDNSLETILSTSSSEISEGEELEERKKKEEICSKIRNYCASCLSNIFRQNSKIIPHYLPFLFSSKPFSKEVSNFVEAIEEPLLLSNSDTFPKTKLREGYWEIIRDEFNEASLLYLILFEENYKVRLSVSKAIASILDGLQNEKITLHMDEKSKESKIEAGKENSHQFCQIFRNLASVVLVTLLVEEDESFFNHLLRLTATLVSNQIYEIVYHDTLQILLNNVLAKVIAKFQYHAIFLNCISCYSSLAFGNFKEKGFEELCLSENFNIIKILFKTAREALDTLFYRKESKVLKQEGVAESTILLESIIALLKFPRHYVEYIIEKSEDLIYIVEKVQTFDKKFVNVVFKLVEETMKNITNNRNDCENAEQDHDAFELKEENHTHDNKTFLANSQAKVENFHISLEKIFKKILTNVHDDNIEYVLNILYYLEEGQWNLYYNDTKQKLLSQVARLNNIQALKQSLLRLLGKICVFPHFIQLDNFHKIIYNVFTFNYPEKNNNIMIKNSWVLANLCANLKNFDVFTVEQNQEILSIILGYCNSSKEKLVSNGFRALGYFISNTSDNMLCQVLTKKNGKAEEIKKSLNEVYLKSFENYSVKVCWNVCVSLSNIFKAFKPDFMKLFFKDPILENISHILASKNNFKTQIHGVEMLALAYEKYPENSCFITLPYLLISIYFLVDEKDFDVSELRYLPHLRESISGLLIELLDNKKFQEDSRNLIKILDSSPHRLLQIFYENIKKKFNIAEEKKFPVKQQSEQDSSKSSDNGLANQRKLGYDNKLLISIEKLDKKEYKELKDYLRKASNLSRRLVKLIDSSDDITVSFAVYEGLQQLAGVDPEAKDQYCNIWLHSL